MVKMQRLEEEKDELKKVIDEERSKHKEEWTDRTGLRRLLQSGIKDMMPKFIRNTAVSGSYKAWRREFKDYALMVDPALEELFMIGESTDKKIDGMYVDHKSSIDLDKSFHYFITSRLEGEAMMLVLHAIVSRAGKEHNSDAEMWRLLMYNFEKKTVYNIVNVVEMIKNVEKVKTIGDNSSHNFNITTTVP